MGIFIGMGTQVLHIEMRTALIFLDWEGTVWECVLHDSYFASCRNFVSCRTRSEKQRLHHFVPGRNAK